LKKKKAYCIDMVFWHMMPIYSVPEAKGTTREITVATAGAVAVSTAVAAASIKTTAGLH
jgi:hypothetical protein